MTLGLEEACLSGILNGSQERLHKGSTADGTNP